MRIINESQPEFRQKIGGYLQKCAPDPRGISLEQLTGILPLSIRELAWIIAICEASYPYTTIPWETPYFRDRVEVLHNIFLNQITQEITNHASANGMVLLSPDARTDAIHKLMGIQWEITHDYNGKGISTYWILSINDPDHFKSIIMRLLAALQVKKSPSIEPVQMMPWIKQSNKEARSSQIIRLLNTICSEQPVRIIPEKISDPIQSYNLAWIIVLCHRKLHWFEDVRLQEQELRELVEITNGKIIDYLQQIGHLHNLKPIYFDEVEFRGSDAVKKIISYDIPSSLVVEVICNDSIYKIKNQIDSRSYISPTEAPDSTLTNKDNFENTDEIIDTTLPADLGLLITKMFPHYKGAIEKKTSAPHRLVIKVMIMMIRLGHADITWIPIKQFIEEHISGNHKRETLANLHEINDDFLIVSAISLSKTNASKNVGKYKGMFGIK